MTDTVTNPAVYRSDIEVDGKVKAVKFIGDIEWNNVQNVPIADSSTLGVVKTGYTTSGKDYKVDADTNGNLHVSVPWTDAKVSQTSLPPSSSYDAEYSILLKYNSGVNTVVTNGVNFTYTPTTINPKTGTITAPHFYNSTTSSSLDFIVGNIISLTEVD